MRQAKLQELRIANGTEIVAALWLMISPFGLGFYLLNPPLWNSVVVGVLIAVFAVLRLVLPPRYGGLSLINATLGGWLIVSPFLFGFSEIGAALWNSAIVGLLIIGLALWSHQASKRIEEVEFGSFSG